MNSHPLYVAILVFIVCVGASCHLSPSHADAWTADEVAVAVARLCVSEASFRASDDCRVIAGIVTRAADRRRLTVADYVASIHHRHTRSTSRPWLAGLSASTEEPAAWTAAVPWERARTEWVRLLGVVRAVQLGDVPSSCSGAYPGTWGGPSVDRERIHRMETLGWRRVDCGTTRNVFLARGER